MTTATRWTETSAHKAIRERSGGLCEVQAPGCLGRATNASHRRPRSLGGLWTPENLLDACGSGTTGCHGWIEAHPLDAKVPGWRVTQIWRDERTVPALIRNVNWPRPAFWHLVGDGLVLCRFGEETHFTALDCDSLCIEGRA